MEKILIASNNLHKVIEVKTILQSVPDLKIFSPSDFGIKMDVDESGNTLEENAALKAKAAFDLLGIPSLSDDTGLFVKSLNGDPGIYSARYAGFNSSYIENYKKLLSKLSGLSGKERNAYFETVICLYQQKDNYLMFRGICKGRISENPTGDFGFGYDPVFIPDGLSNTFAELSEDQKNKISHRASALKHLQNFLKSENINS